MIKKLVKYGKILMALTLIGALSIPSYATVGASDGSAFVTKAEFDAALSDFNARLTTFEAGINSKIDSQVSSYLDRNGIWNGKNQTIEHKLINDTTYMRCCNYWCVSSEQSSTDATRLQSGTIGASPFNYFIANKSGLAVMQLKTSTWSEGRCYISIEINDGKTNTGTSYAILGQANCYITFSKVTDFVWWNSFKTTTTGSVIPPDNSKWNIKNMIMTGSANANARSTDHKNGTSYENFVWRTNDGGAMGTTTHGLWTLSVGGYGGYTTMFFVDKEDIIFYGLMVTTAKGGGGDYWAVMRNEGGLNWSQFEAKIY